MSVLYNNFRILRIGIRKLLFLKHAQGHVLLFPEEYQLCIFKTLLWVLQRYKKPLGNYSPLFRF